MLCCNICVYILNIGSRSMEWLLVERFRFLCVWYNNIDRVPEFVLQHIGQFLIHLIHDEIRYLHAKHN